MKTKAAFNFKTIATALLAGVSALAFATPASADLISDRFDGVYAGEIRVNDVLAKSACAALPLAKVEINDGNMWGFDAYGKRVARGLVTEDGFFTGEYHLPDGKKTEFEGVVDENGVFTGGIVEKDCAWLADLKRKQGKGVT